MNPLYLFESKASTPVEWIAFGDSDQSGFALDGTARLWDVASGRNLAVLKGHAFGVVTAKFSPSGDRIVTASYDKTARIWNVPGGE